MLANPLYQNITSRFVHSHDYLAMEQLHELHASGEYDLVVVDTPPSRNALVVLDAPARMVEFFGSRLLRWLTVPVPVAPVHDGLEALLPGRRPGAGLPVPAGHRRLLRALPGDGEGIRARAREVEALLGDPRTTFLVVTTLETAPAHEARSWPASCWPRDYDLGAIVANRVLPPR